MALYKRINGRLTLFNYMNEEMQMGVEVEKEHTRDPNEAEKIAREHLEEDPKYYSKLKEAGL